MINDSRFPTDDFKLLKKKNLTRYKLSNGKVEIKSSGMTLPQFKRNCIIKFGVLGTFKKLKGEKDEE